MSWNWELAPEMSTTVRAGSVNSFGRILTFFGDADGQAFVEDAEAVSLFDRHFGGGSK
jgi:hypothetical protein